MEDRAAKTRVSEKPERKYRSYSYEDRLDVIMMSDSGMSSTEIRDITGIDDSLIRYWVRRYRRNGMDALKRKRYSSAPIPTTGKPGIKGYVRYIDNPEILNAQFEKLRQAGIESEDIIVSVSAGSMLGEMSGSTVVMNSLFDLASDLPGIIRLLSIALRKDVTIISLNDGKVELNSKDQDTVNILAMFERYAYANMKRLKNNNGSEMKMKRTYAGLNSVETMVEPESEMLASSVTDVPLEVNDVTVENFTSGFDNDGNDFETISFD
ncbi:MAG: helix-turn-helix domain containing protein [Bacteroidales bacterium]|nr:helix-turn-helix domain containing protein [Bacteroidales bacterium]